MGQHRPRSAECGGCPRSAESWEHVPFRAGTPATHLASLAAAEGKLYVGTISCGPWRFDPASARWQSLNLDLLQNGQHLAYMGEHNAVKWDNIYCMLAAGRRIWMGTNHGLIVHDPARTPRGL